MDAAPFAPMEARLAEALPDAPGWQYEPKWDGFRAIAARGDGDVEIWSKSGKPLGRYFPEMLAALATVPERRYILDGELVIPIGDHLSFDALQARLHPAASRIAKLAVETPVQLILFDCLRLCGDDLIDAPLDERRSRLEKLYARIRSPALILSPCTTDRSAAQAGSPGPVARSTASSPSRSTRPTNPANARW